MPNGILIFTEDIQNGLEIKAKYPEDLEISENILKIIRLSHSLEENSNFSNLITGNFKIASYYTGSQFNYFVSLFLTNEEDPVIFENILSFITPTITDNLSNDNYKSILPNLYNQISLYPNFEEEQKLAIAYSDEIKRLIIGKLVEEANISKKELLKWLKEKLQVEDLVINPLLNSLTELGLIKISPIEEFSEDFVFLIGDFFITRLSPSNLIEKVNKKQIPQEIGSKYLKKVKDFFQNYSKTSEDEKKIIDVISDLDCYNLLKFLRLSPLTKEGLSKIRSKIDDIDTALKKIRLLGAFEIIKDKNGEEFYFLITDLHIQRFFPEYLLEIILNKYNNKSAGEYVTIQHLNLLKNEFQLEIENIREKSKKEKI